MTTACDYDIPPWIARDLLPIALLPTATLRIDALAAFEAEHGRHALLGAFGQFIGLANSVAANAREMAEVLLITEGNVHFATAEKINLPTVVGALNGVTLAQVADPAKTCGGCAFRIGTPANQSPVTTTDAGDCVDSAEKFMCHEDLDDKGRPTKACAGWAQIRALQKRAESDAAP